MNRVFASQLTGSDLGKRVRIRLGADAAVEDVLVSIEHDLASNNQKTTWVWLSKIQAPEEMFSALARTGGFRFSSTEYIEVAE